jgi:hypothetical protein
MSEEIIDFTKHKAVKEFIATAQERIGMLENTLYSILDLSDVSEIKQLVADALGEDLDIYLEEELDVPELDFEDDSNIEWSDLAKWEE